MTLPLKPAYFQRFLFSAGIADLEVKPSGVFASRDITEFRFAGRRGGMISVLVFEALAFGERGYSVKEPSLQLVNHSSVSRSCLPALLHVALDCIR